MSHLHRARLSRLSLALIAALAAAINSPPNIAVSRSCSAPSPANSAVR